MASYYANTKQLTHSVCLAKLYSWNSKNTPPLATNEIQSLLKSAQSGKYTHSCSDQILEKLCEMDGCPFVKKEDQKIKKLNEEQEKVKTLFLELSKDKHLLSRILEELSITVKDDYPLIITTLIGSCSSLIKPLNISVKSESGQGKTYVVMKTLEYIPKEQKIVLAGMTPKSLIYDHGIFKDQEEKIIDFEDKPIKPNRKMYDSDLETYNDDLKIFKESSKEWRERIANSYYEIDLTNKILCLLEPPSYECFMFLKVIMSHDEFLTKYKMVNKSSVGKNVTINVILKGWPCTIILGTDKKYIEEYATRTFTVTPDSHIEKIESANRIINDKASYPFLFNKESITKKAIKKMFQSIRDVVIKNNLKVIFPFPEFHREFRREIIRDMRDFDHFIQFVQSFTILKLFQRPILEINNEKYLVSTKEDLEEAYVIFNKIIETTRTNTEERILSFYRIVFLEKTNKPNKNPQTQLTIEEDEEKGVTIDEAVKKYNLTQKTPKSDHRIRIWTDRLNKIGYLEKRPHPTDKRRNIYYPLRKNPENTSLLKWDVLLKSRIEKDCEKWLNNMCTLDHFRTFQCNSSSLNLIEYSLKKEIFINIILNREPTRVCISSKDEPSLESENKEVTTSFPKRDVLSTSSKPVVFVKNGANSGEVCFYCKKPAEIHLVDIEHETPVCQTCLDEKESVIKEHYCLKKLEVP